jgi:hypothetical protein
VQSHSLVLLMSFVDPLTLRLSLQGTLGTDAKE